MEVSFYHLTKNALDKTLPRLLEKVLASGLRAVVVTDTDERVAYLDSLLWTYGQLAFLPHGTFSDDNRDHHPILVGTEYNNYNNATIAVVTDGSLIEKTGSFIRCLDIFNGLDEDEVIRTRDRWRHYKSLGHSVVYWKQDEAGLWIKS